MIFLLVQREFASYNYWDNFHHFQNATMLWLTLNLR